MLRLYHLTFLYLLMSITLKKIFRRNKNLVIGSLHFPPLLGFDDFPGFKQSLKMALQDLKAYEEGGADGIFLENNYGLSAEKITTPQAVAMGYLIGEIRAQTKLPLGVSVLWNDYETAFALAKTYQLQFIRVPVFVDTVQPYCGLITGTPKDVQKVRTKLGAQDVAIYADIMVKHAKHISTHTLATSAKKAIKAGADAVIVTGGWTGDAPTAQTVSDLRQKIADFPILIGSGADVDNVADLLGSADGVIVSTSLKGGAVDAKERNVKGFEQRVQKSKVTKFVNKVKT